MNKHWHGGPPRALPPRGRAQSIGLLDISRRGRSQGSRPGRRPDLPWLCARGLRPVNVPVSIHVSFGTCASSRAVGLSRPGRAGVCPGRHSGSPGTSLPVCAARGFALACARLSPVSTGSLVLRVPELPSTVVSPEWGLAVVGRHVFPTATSWTCLLPDGRTLPPVCSDCSACPCPGRLAVVLPACRGRGGPGGGVPRGGRVGQSGSFRLYSKSWAD